MNRKYTKQFKKAAMDLVRVEGEDTAVVFIVHPLKHTACVVNAGLFPLILVRNQSAAAPHLQRV